MHATVALRPICAEHDVPLEEEVNLLDLGREDKYVDVDISACWCPASEDQSCTDHHGIQIITD